MLRVTHQDTIHMGEKKRGPGVGTHPDVPSLWAVGSGCRLPAIVLALEQER